MGNYDEFRLALAPPWLRGAVADSWHTGHGSVEDEIAQSAKDAVKAKFPNTAPVDALPYLGADRQLERGPSESEAAFRARLVAAPDAWAWAGTRKGVLDYALAPAGWTNARIVENRDWATISTAGGVSPDGLPANIAKAHARFWVIVGRPPTYTQAPWDDGVAYDAPGATWDSGAPFDDVRRLERLVKQWKPAHAMAMGAIVVFGATTVPDAVPTSGRWREDSLAFGGASCMFWRFSGARYF